MRHCLAAYYRFVVLFFNCLLTFGSYFCFDIPSVLQDQFQGVSKRQRCLQIASILHDLIISRERLMLFLMFDCCFLTEPDVSQCDGDQRDSGLCGGTGDDPSAVQSSLCHLCLDVSTLMHWFHCENAEKWLINEKLLSVINRNAVVVILAGFLIDKLGNRCKFCFMFSLYMVCSYF